MLLDCTHIRQLNVYECQPLFYLDCHLPPTLNLQKNLLAFSLSLKGWSWSSLCLSCMSLFEFLFTLLMLLMCEFHLFIFSVAFLLLFQTCVLVTLQACVFDVFPNSCYFSKLTFWCSWSSHSCYFSWIDSCCFFQSCSCCSKLVTRFFVAPSAHSYYSFRSCSCCSMLTFMLLFSVVFLLLQTCVLVAPSLCWNLCFHGCVIVVPSLCSSVILPNCVLLLQAHIFGTWNSIFFEKISMFLLVFLIFCFVFWPFLSSLLDIGLSRWLFLLCPLDVVALQGYPLFLAFLLYFFFQNYFYFGLPIVVKSSLAPLLPPFHLDLV
jgi:hypothetical protein